MLESRTFYTVLCDRCGKDAFAEDDVAAYSDRQSAVEVLRDSHDWLITADGKHSAMTASSGMRTRTSGWSGHEHIPVLTAWP